MQPSEQDEGHEEHRAAEQLTDGRAPGNFVSRYPARAWWQIGIEFSYLVGVLAAISVALLYIGALVAADTPADAGNLVFGIKYPEDRRFLIWLSIALSGSAGGTAFALKWLYHSVAKWTWNRDRLLWRLIVPALSGVFAVFVAFMVSAEIVPFLNAKAFDSFYRALGSGFLLGYFSDNVLAALQNLAIRWFGTVDKPSKGEGE
jgi:hypothetical protein